MHEVGHTLGLLPQFYPGIDNNSLSALYYWRNYQSCMNYWMMYRPFLYRLIGKNFGLVLDYSDGTRDEFGHPDHNDWDHIDLSYFQKSSSIIEGIE